MNIRDESTTIGSIVASNPNAATVFEQFQVDYCCGGHRRLTDIILDQTLDQDALYQALEASFLERSSAYNHLNFTEMSPSVLCAYIEDTHHAFCNEQTPRIAELLALIARVHGNNHPELFEVYRLFASLRSELEPHLLKEEVQLFPRLSDPTADVGDLAREIIAEHESVGEILAQLRHVTKHYTIPDDVCGTFVKAYGMLKEMEQDLHQHIHLENNVLLVSYDHR